MRILPRENRWLGRRWPTDLAGRDPVCRRSKPDYLLADRLLITATGWRCLALVCVNKVDAYGGGPPFGGYGAGYPLIRVSAETGRAGGAVQALRGRPLAWRGTSGVGKSSLLEPAGRR